MKISAQQFCQDLESRTIIDVRSPSEFENGHIPHASNLPLFNDDERAEVGTIYKEQGKQLAIERGLEIVGPKLANLSRKLLTHKKEKLFIHCWRGGLRSESIAWLANICGIKTTLLEKGYKGYRNFVIKTLEQKYLFFILGGKTGSGKTELLLKLKERGEQVLDLEGLAHHKGSIFGDLGNPKQPTPQFFENSIANELNKFNPSKMIWVENESSSIGRVHIPKSINDQIRCAPLLQIEIPNKVRKERIIKEYGHFSTELLKERVLKIERRLGGQNCKTVLKALDNNDINTATDFLMEYYDRTYTHSTNKRPSTSCSHLKLQEGTISEWATEIIKKTRGYNGN